MKSKIFSPFDYLSKTLIDTYYLLENPSVNNDKKIHAVRVMSKQIRSLIYLIKPFLKNKEFTKSQIESYKQLSKKLAHKREMKVLDDTLSWIIKKSKLSINDFAKIKSDIKHEIDQLNNTTGYILASKASILKEFENIGAYKEIRVSKKNLKKRLKKTYKKTLSILEHAMKTNDIEDIHHFRKYAKYYMYQLQLLSNQIACPKKTIEDLDKLTSILGKTHDIDFLDKYLKEREHLQKSNLLQQHLDKQLNKLVKQAFRLSQKIFKKS